MTDEVKKVYRLDPDMLAAVRHKAQGGAIAINHNTTPIQAGFQLGVQHVLNILQEGFTVAGSAPTRE